MYNGLFDLLAAGAGVVRLFLFCVFAGVAIWCVKHGTSIFKSSAEALAAKGNDVIDNMELSWGQTEKKLVMRGASGLALIALAIILAITLVRTEFNFEYDRSGGNRRLTSRLFGISTAQAQSNQTSNDLDSFCQFVKDGAPNIKVRIKSADGSSLSEARSRVLIVLNEMSAVGGVAGLSKAQQLGLAEDFSDDKTLLNYVRYLIVESAINEGRLLSFCNETVPADLSFGREITSLLSLRIR